VVGAVGLVALFAALDALRREGPVEAAPSALTVTTPSPARPPVELRVAGGVATDRPAALAAGLDTLWIASASDRSVSRFDPERGRVTARVPLDREPGLVAAGGNDVWAAETRAQVLFRLDAEEARLVRRLPLPAAPVALAADAAGAWVATGGRALLHVDAATGVVDAVADVPGARRLTLAAGALWVLTREPETLVRVDPVRRRVTARLELEPVSSLGAPTALAAGGGAIWILYGSRRALVRVQAEDLRIDAVAGVDGDVFSLTAGNGALWATGAEAVLRLDPETGAVTGRGSLALARRPGPEPLDFGGVAWTDGSLWVGDPTAGAVVEVHG
jgi:hypothetical protein